MSFGKIDNNDLFRWESPGATPPPVLKPQAENFENYITTQLLYRDVSGGGIWFYVEHHAVHTRAGYLVRRGGEEEIFQQLKYAIDFYNNSRRNRNGTNS